MSPDTMTAWDLALEESASRVWEMEIWRELFEAFGLNQREHTCAAYQDALHLLLKEVGLL